MLTLISLISIALIIGIDQLIKWIIVKNYEFKGSVPFIHIGDFEIINLSYHKNTGAAFSIFSGMQIFLIIITSIFILAGIYAIVSGKVNMGVPGVYEILYRFTDEFDNYEEITKLSKQSIEIIKETRK